MLSNMIIVIRNELEPINSLRVKIDDYYKINDPQDKNNEVKKPYQYINDKISLF